MTKFMNLMEDVFFKYFPEQNKILFIKSAYHSDYIFILKSVQYAMEMNALLTGAINDSSFLSLLKQDAKDEYEQIVQAFKKLGLIQSEGSYESFALEKIFAGTIFRGQHFKLHFESLKNGILVSTISEDEKEMV